MKAAFKKEWIADLRSTKFKQGKHSLRLLDGRNCCLGVACETGMRIDPSFPVKRDEPGGYMWEPPAGDKGWPSSTRLNGLLPDPLCGLIGLPYNLMFKLADMNDGGWTFEEIADWIEENIPVDGEQSNGETPTDEVHPTPPTIS